jgi:MinD superfamily P-loop ATPase
MSPPLIRELKETALKEAAKDVILDCPPGTTCPMIEAVRNTDYCILVTEPTPFGLHDLEMAAKAVAQMGIPAGVIINRAYVGGENVHAFCQKHGLPVLLEIPNMRKIAEGYASGQDLIEIMPGLKQAFEEVLKEVAGRIAT